MKKIGWYDLEKQGDDFFVKCYVISDDYFDASLTDVSFDFNLYEGLEEELEDLEIAEDVYEILDYRIEFPMLESDQNHIGMKVFEAISGLYLPTLADLKIALNEILHEGEPEFLLKRKPIKEKVWKYCEKHYVYDCTCENDLEDSHE